MASCPSCQVQIEIGAEFYGGLFTCPVCSGVYFIGFDGVPEASIPAETHQPTESFDYASSNTIPEANVFEGVNVEVEPLVPIDSLSPVFMSPLQDVIDFANSENSKSLSSYSVTIEGLEVANSLQAFREILSDSKLQINFDQVKARIKNGKLRLEKLDPAQAAVLAFRLRPLSLEIKWEQSLQ